MASYRLSAQAISRGDGRSAIAAAAYRTGTKLTDERTGIVHDYTPRMVDRDGKPCAIAHTAILAPDNAPEWMRDRPALWNAVERCEKRRDAQLSREVQLSLPHELNDVQRRELVEQFTRDAFVSRGMIADVAIHRPQADKGENPRNHHAHIMLTMRELTGDGFDAKKQRDWNARPLLESWREDWAKAQNAALEAHNHKDRVSAKSLKDQGVKRRPQIHLGAKVSQMKKRGADHPRIDRYQHIEKRNAQLAQAQDTRRRQLQEAQDEVAELHESIRKAGLWGVWQKLTGQRRAEIERVEDLQRFHAKTRESMARLKAQEQANREEQRRIVERRDAAKKKAEQVQGRKAANDDRRPPERPKQPRPPPTRPKAPKPPQRPTRPLTEAAKPPAPPKAPRRPPERPRTRRDGDPDLER